MSNVFGMDDIRAQSYGPAYGTASGSASRTAEVRYGLVGAGYFGMALGRGLGRLEGARITRV